MTSEHIERIRTEIRLGIDRDNDEGAVSRPALLTAVVALAVCWFVITRPVVAAAFVVGGLCIVGFVTVVGLVGWVLFVWGAPRSEPTLPESADADADRYAGGGW